MEEAVANARWLDQRRRTAWADGRERVDHLLAKYAQKYNLDVPPPPALVAAELIRDVLDVPLFFDPMPLDRYAEVRVVDGEPRVTVNSDIDQMENVKDGIGVANVAMLHEVIHIERDLSALVSPASMQLPGFEEPPAIVCLRAPAHAARNEVAAREFWAEEAGRAAAVSPVALRRSAPFRELLLRATKPKGEFREAWPLLYDVASELGVNISALRKQLELEALIVVSGKDVLVQPGLLELAEWGQ